MLNRFVSMLCLVLSLVSVSACTRGPMRAGTAAAVTSSGDRQIEPYRLGAGDKVRITVFGEDKLTGEYFVSTIGQIAFPLVGEIQAGGKTLQELQFNVETKLADGYIRNPRVSAEVLNYRPFYILGEVDKPGEYPYTAGLTVMNAVATAHGFTYRADTKRIYIKRADSPNEEPFDLTTTTPVQPGDTIRIRERLF